jgi:heat shock protein HslJ
MQVRAMAAAVTLIATVGCADHAGSAGGGDTLLGRTFLSEAVTEDEARFDLVNGTRVRLEFTGDGQLVAHAGCNTLFTEVRTDGGALETSGIGGTEMGCDPARHEQDEWLAGFLTGSPAWMLDGDRLTLTGGATEMVLLDREVADPDRPLESTRWVVDTIVMGDAASSMVAGTEGVATLVIEDGAFTADSGCREITGRVEVGEHRLRFRDVVQADPICLPDLEEVDRVMVEVLTGEVEFLIQADRLRLDHAGAVGLGLHSDEQ